MSTEYDLRLMYTYCTSDSLYYIALLWIPLLVDLNTITNLSNWVSKPALLLFAGEFLRSWS